MTIWFIGLLKVESPFTKHCSDVYLFVCRSQSITEPQHSMAPGPLSPYPNDNSRVDQLVSPSNQPVHSAGSSEQNMNKNGPVLHSQLRQDIFNMQDSSRESKVKPENDSVHKSVVVESKLVPKKESRSGDLNSIQYENLSNLMNRGPAKLVSHEDDDDYDT